MVEIVNKKALTYSPGLFLLYATQEVSIFLRVLFSLQKINVSECCSKADKHSDDSDKNVGAVSNELLKHGYKWLAKQRYIAAINLERI